MFIVNDDVPVPPFPTPRVPVTAFELPSGRAAKAGDAPVLASNGASVDPAPVEAY